MTWTKAQIVYFSLHADDRQESEKNLGKWLTSGWTIAGQSLDPTGNYMWYTLVMDI